MCRTLLVVVFLVFLGLPVRAQLCNGSLGDPVAWISFGEGSGSSSPPLPASRTTYEYTGSSCPSPGRYTIGNLSFGCFDQAWHTLVGDHTPNDAGGRYMLINSGNTQGLVYQDTLSGLCGNTSYELSAWILNAVKLDGCGNTSGIDPNLNFTVESLSGAVLATYNTGDITETETPQWRQYGTFFRTPVNAASVVIRIRNTAANGCGNAFAMDDITLRACGPRVNTVLAINNENFIGICVGDPRTFQIAGSVSAGFADPRLQWQRSLDNGVNWADIPGATNLNYIHPPSGEGFYMYRLVVGDGININNPVCRIASRPVTIQVTPPPFIQATNYVFSCYGSTVNLFASGGSTYRWVGPNGFRSDLQGPSIPNIQFNQAGLYTVTVTTAFGCVASTSTNLEVYPAVTLTRIPDQNICEGESVQLFAGGGTRYRWEPRQGLSNQEISNPIASPTDSTAYKLIVVNDAGCFDTATVRVNVWKRPQANAGPDLRTITGYPVQLQASASGTDVRYSWSPVQNMSNFTSIRPTVTLNATSFPQTFPFRLEVISNRGCGTATDETTVTVFETVKVPNTFTPNGDGFNDFWEIELLRIFPDAVIEVYNTAGSIVYRSVTYPTPWDGTRNGKPLPSGTYYYTIDLKVQNSKRLTGYVTLLR